MQHFLKSKSYFWRYNIGSSQIKSRFPQGSVIIPILLIIYIKDEPDNLINQIAKCKLMKQKFPKK